MAQTHGFLEDKRADTAMFEVMDVRAADTSLADLDEDLVAFDLGDGALKSQLSRWGGGRAGRTFSYLTSSMEWRTKLGLSERSSGMVMVVLCASQ
jgi:hypothetical protein